MRKGTTAVAAIAVAALAAGAAGCGGDDNESSSTTPASTPAPAQTQQRTATQPTGGAQNVNVGAAEFSFTPSTLKARTGQVTFTLRNNGAAPHAMEIEGQGVEAKTGVIQGGQTATLKVRLKPGRYEFYCPVDGHRQMGMQGTITVT